VTDRSSYLLAIMMLFSAIQALDTLLIWSDPLRVAILELNGNLLFLGSFSYWLQGPLLYWYVRSVLYRRFRFSPKDAWHLVPTLIVGIFLMWHYYLIPEPEKLAAMTNLQFMWTPLMTWMVLCWHLSIIGYCSWCLVNLARYRKQLQEQYANVEKRERRWLTWTVVGFMTIASWKLMVHLVGNNLERDTANILGIVSNYMTFMFVNSLVFISIRYVHLFDGLDRSSIRNDAPKPFSNEQVDRVVRFMAKQKPHLDHDITIDTLAKRLSLPERTLSRILNQNFGRNFFEFINAYRVDEAKRLLSCPEHKDSSMLEVMHEAGFTSKSTFNAIFKKHLGQTPSQYRKNATSWDRILDSERLTVR
jgi:AraC-like DNA-binding protein